MHRSIHASSRSRLVISSFSPHQQTRGRTRAVWTSTTPVGATQGYSVDARHSNPSNCPIRIRNVQTINDVVYIRCLIMGGPFDVYYMIRPENSVRGDPGDREVMRFGEKVGERRRWNVGGAVCG